MIRIVKSSKTITVYVDGYLLHRYLRSELQIGELSVLIFRKAVIQNGLVSRSREVLVDLPRASCVIIYK